MIEVESWSFDIDAMTSTQIRVKNVRRGERCNALSASESPRSRNQSQGNFEGHILTEVEGSTGGSAEGANLRRIVKYHPLSDEF
jgi:hypothetical protein